MHIAKHKVVTIDYTLTDDTGKVLDTSSGGEPLSYIQGIGNLIPGLETALEGKAAGDDLNVSVPPEQGYGERDDSLLMDVPRDRFENPDAIELGTHFHTPTEDGYRVVTVVSIGDDKITVDANHPLAGTTLNFDVKVVEVRDATAEEISHGHVHGPDDHHHDH